MFCTLDLNNELINSVYQRKAGDKGSNIMIRENKSTNNLCYIYFSSNDLYRKDNSEDFKQKIILNNRFEWTNISANIKPKLEIFVRDVWLSWYCRGISSELNNYDKMIDYLREISMGYNLVTVGVSSGGFMAALAAVKLKAEMCFDFSGQFSLKNHFFHVINNPFLKSYYRRQISNEKEVYTELYHLIRNSNDTVIYYFFSAYCEQDVEQSAFAEHCECVRIIRFNSHKHGVTVFSVNLPKLLSCTSTEIEKIWINNRDKNINQVVFSIKLSGLTKTASFVKKRIFREVKRKLRYKGYK